MYTEQRAILCVCVYVCVSFLQNVHRRVNSLSRGSAIVMAALLFSISLISMFIRTPEPHRPCSFANTMIGAIKKKKKNAAGENELI